MATEERFHNWRYWSDARQTFWPLPRWAVMMMDLGSAVAQLPSELGPTTTAIAVPTRGFCASLVAAGFLLAKNEDSAFDKDEHLAFLRSLAVGTTVWIYDNNVRKEARFGGIETKNGREYVALDMSRGNISFIPVESANKVQVSSFDRQLKRAVVRPQEAPSDFANVAFGEQLDVSFMVRSRVDAVLVGRKNRIVRELTAQQFGIATEDGVVDGQLKEVVRAIGGENLIENQGFNTELVSESDFPDSSRGIATLVVFDGALAVRGSRQDRGGDAHRIIVLDRSARGFDDACLAIDDRFLHRVGKVKASLLPDLVSGVEMVSFVRRRV